MKNWLVDMLKIKNKKADSRYFNYHPINSITKILLH